MAGEKDPMDPKGLIRESYRIEGISEGECRSIFLDWALGVQLGADMGEMVRALLARYSDQPSDHPMTIVLNAALEKARDPRRRGGRSARVRQ